MGEAFGALVVLAEHDAYDVERRFLRRLAGQSMMAILDRRLRRIGSPRAVVCLLPKGAAALADEARRLGWTTVVGGRQRPAHLAVVARCLGVGGWLRFDLCHPFVLPELARVLLAELSAGGGAVEAEPASALAPVAAMSRGVLFRRVVARLAHLQAQQAPWPWRPPALAQRLASCLTVDSASEELVERLGGLDFTLVAVEAVAGDAGAVSEAVGAARDRLAGAVEGSEQPHLANARLARFEMEHRFADVKSLPPTLAVNISRSCNARCAFCAYGAPEDPGFGSPRHVTLAQIRGLDWLRFVERVQLGGDVGDPLTNPEYDEIVAFLRAEHPQLKLLVLTNGLGLTEERCNALVGHAEVLGISLHAARRETWQRLTRARGFDRIVQQIAWVAEQKKRRRTVWPRVVLFVVLTRENVEELVEVVELAHRLGVQRVEASHFEKAVMPGCDLPDASSLFAHRELSDRCVEAASRRARELKLAFKAPRLFRDDSAQPAVECSAAWLSCLLFFRPDGRPVLDFCCVPVGKGVGYSWADLNEESVRALWNAPVIRHFRSTVNTAPSNRVCAVCRRGLFEEPDGAASREIAAGLAEIQGRLGVGAPASGLHAG